MSLRRSVRRKVCAPEPLSDSNEPASSTTTAASTRKHKVQPALKDRAEAFLANAANSPTRLSATKSRKRKLGDVHDEKPSKAPAPDPPDASSAPLILRSKARGPTRLHDSGAPKLNHEKRLRHYREKAPQSFLEKLHRAQSQRMIVLKRTRTDVEAFPREKIDIVGSTGNIYTVTVGQIPSCTCPDHQKGNECKHKVYALHTVLKAPAHLVYQLSFLSSELREIFGGAPPIPSTPSISGNTDGHRKPVEGECPICYQDYEAETNALVWCKAACGQNVHQSCFGQWVAAQGGTAVRCVFCRTLWEADHGDLQTLSRTGVVNAEGYVNVADQFGMSGVRDYSAYNRFSRHALGLGWR